MRNLNKGIKASVIGVTAALSLLGGSAAHASLLDGIVDVWTVGVSGQFLCGTAVFTSAGPVQTCAPTTMNWGSNGISGLDISNLPAANVTTNGAAVANTSVTHRNQPINEPSLDSVTLQSTLTLTPFSPPSAALPSVSIDFLIDFLETPNGANPCADGEPNGGGVNNNGCSDIFVIDKTSLNFPFFYDLDGAGPLQNQQYFISFFEQTNGLNPLPAAACASVGVAAPCLGFRTPEEANTTFQFAALITTEPVSVVPEPGSLALLGLGLAGLGALRRRKQ